MGIIERILTKIFPYVDIMRRDDMTRIYLRRFFIYPRNKDFSKNVVKRRLYLHKFYKGDEDPHPHSHPWPFTSLLLTRGYWEETPANQAEATGEDHLQSTVLYRKELLTGEMRKWRFYPRFSILHRPAKWQHRVKLVDNQPVWTLVRTGVKERTWGFWIGDKMCPHREYDNGECLIEPIIPKD